LKDPGGAELKKLFILFSIVLILGQGCGISRETCGSAGAYNRITKNLSDKEVIIVLGTGEEVWGKYVNASLETTSWLDLTSLEKRSMPTSEIDEIYFRTKTSGVFPGMVIGGMTFSGGGKSTSEAGVTVDASGLSTFFGTLLGGIVGIGVGGAVGNHHEQHYILNSPVDSYHVTPFEPDVDNLGF
jgi:hypothetical protein